MKATTTMANSPCVHHVLNGLLTAGLFLLCSSLPTPAQACGAEGGNTGCNDTDAGSTQSTGADRGAQNPIDLITGNKYQREIDHQPGQGSLATSLSFVRHYSSHNHLIDNGQGPGWSHTWQVQLSQTASDEYQLIQSDGRRIVFNFNTEDEQRQRYDAINPADGHLLVTEAQIRWQLNDGRRLDFSLQGQLTQIHHSGGYTQTLSYQRTHLTRIEDNRGQHLNLTYYGKPGLRDYDPTIPREEQDRLGAEDQAATNKLQSLELTDGNKIHYYYDGLGNLKQVTYPDSRTRTYHYEHDQYPHALTGISDTQGKRIASWGYDANGRANHHHKADGVDRIDLTYTLPEDVGGIGTTTLFNSLNQQSTYTWQHYRHDSQPLLLKTQGPGCSHCPEANVEYEYTDQHQIKAIHRKASTTHYVYDELGRTLRVTQNAPTGESHLIARYEYDPAKPQQTRPSAIILPSVNPAGEHRVEITYDAQQQPTRITEQGFRPTPDNSYVPISRSTELTYENGNLTIIDGPREDVEDLIQLSYDDHRQLTRLTGPDGIPLQVKAHDHFGRPTQIQRGSHSPTDIVYTANGQIESISQYNQSVSYTYTDSGQLKTLTGPNDDTLTLSYDEAGRATGLTGPDGRKVQDILDSEGQLNERNLIGVNGDLIQSISNLYDAQGRLQSTTRNGQLSQKYDYDNADRLTQVTNVSGQDVRGCTNAAGAGCAGAASSTLNYGPLGQLQSLIAPDQSRISVSYDDKGQAIALTDPRENTTTHLKDDFGHIVQSSHPDTGIQTYQYDAAGNRIQKTDAEGKVTRYMFDVADRLKSETNDDGVTTLSYDPNSGQLKSLVNADSTETFTYTTEGQLKSHTRLIDGHSFTTRYGYNDKQQLSHKTLPDGQVLNYHYYEQGKEKDKLRAITKESFFGLGQETIIGEIDHDKTDGQTGHTYGNGIRMEYHWDEQGQLSSISNNKALELHYSYDDYGRISGIDLNGQRQAYLHDERGRLVAADTLLGQFRYGYDRLGNRTAKQTIDQTGSILTENYNYPEPGEGNRLLGIEQHHSEAQTPTSQTTLSINYNQAGSPIKSEGLSYEYNAQQRPIKVSKDGQLIAEYRYNRFGERIRKTVYQGSTKKPKITYYFYDGNTLTAEANQLGEITAQYLYHNGHQPVAKLEDKQVYAIHSDHLGTPRIATNDQGETVWSANYTPFGKAEIQQRNITLNLRLPGQYEDTETGTYYNYLRDYNPKTGRYQTSDPIGLKGGLNSYAYVRGNPLALMDPLGLVPLSDPTSPIDNPESLPEIPHSDGTSAEDGPVIMEHIEDWLSDAGDAVMGELIGPNFEVIATEILGRVPGELGELIKKPGYENIPAGLAGAFNAEMIKNTAFTLAIFAAIDQGADFVINKPNPWTYFGGKLAKWLVKQGVRVWIAESIAEEAKTYFDKLYALGQTIVDLKDLNLKDENGQWTQAACDKFDELAGQLAHASADFAINAGMDKFNKFSDKVKFDKKKKKEDKQYPIDEAYKKYIKKGGVRKFDVWFWKLAPKKFSVDQLRKYARKNNWEKNNKILWPPNDGFTRTSKRQATIKSGWEITRYVYGGDLAVKNDDGAFVSKNDVPFEKRALKGKVSDYTLARYRVIKDIPAISGQAMAWFDQPGGSTQYLFENNWKIQYLLEKKYIKRIEE